jgi:hypothetical protein
MLEGDEGFTTKEEQEEAILIQQRRMVSLRTLGSSL